MDEKELQEAVRDAAERLEVPGASIAVFNGGEEHYAFHGVTSLENPLPVDEDTLFQFGSTGKTFTATAIMRLVEQGKVALDAPVLQYVPELKLKDEDVANRVTVLHLLNHTAGWQGDLMDDTGDGDDALTKYIALMANIEQVSPLGATVSYNNASLSVAGFIIAKAMETTYEKAMKQLIFEPLGLSNTFFFMNDIITRRFAVGHTQHPDGSITVARPWALPRGNAPAGGMSANAGDQILWARFHLGDGRAADGTQVLSSELLSLMQQPTVDMRGSALGDAVGISWLLRDVDGTRIVQHGGTTNGQHSSFLIVPERQFGFIAMTNSGPNGPQLNDEIEKLVLAEYLGVVDADPEPVALPADKLAEYTGNYETIAAICAITAGDTGGLVANIEIKPEVRARLREQGEDEPEQPPIPLAFIDPAADRFIVSEGPAKGMKGYFVRAAAGAGSVEGVHLGGRLATKTPA